MKHRRKYRPLAVELEAALRQFDYGNDATIRRWVLRCKQLRILKIERDRALKQGLGLDPKTAQLDHHPALGLRRKIRHRDGSFSYDPDENDPHYMVWRDADDHHTKTYGTPKGQKVVHTADGDIHKIRKADRVRDRHAEHVQRREIPGFKPDDPIAGIDDYPKTIIPPKRNLQSRGFQKGHRPLRSRGFQKRRS